MAYRSSAPAQRDWESVFTSWARPPGETERAKCENAERQIKEAIDRSPELSWRTIEVFPQGSYRNRTNVRAESDVDICVRCMDVFFFDLYDEITEDQARVGHAEYTYGQFKNEVERALRSYFGTDAVTRGNKAFDVHATSTRVDADVVATFEYRRYRRAGDGRIYYHSGTELRPDHGGRVINWPQQNYDEGVNKNENTARRFKKLVRILKRLRNEMAENGWSEADPIPSFLIECLVYNVPNALFGHNTFTEDVEKVLGYIFEQTSARDRCRKWVEVSGLKWLFGPHQAWAHEQASAFSAAALTYVFYE